jgi:hypothetical protein
LILASAFSLTFVVLIVGAQHLLHDNRFLKPPGDWAGPAWVYLVVVMLFGAVGALFTAIPAISKIPSDYGPFNLPLQQALLKIVFGPLVAVVGLFILSADALQLGMPHTWAGILLLAVVFGAGQQAVTRYVDQRAGEILTAGAPGSTTK